MGFKILYVCKLVGDLMFLINLIKIRGENVSIYEVWYQIGKWIIYMKFKSYYLKCEFKYKFYFIYFYIDKN